MPELIAELGLKSAAELHVALGAGDLHLSQVVNALQRRNAQARAAKEAARSLPAAETRLKANGKPAAPGGVVVDGVGDLMSNFARCCRPVPPRPGGR